MARVGWQPFEKGKIGIEGDVAECSVVNGYGCELCGCVEDSGDSGGEGKCGEDWSLRVAGVLLV
jgi:hypothetical protein